MDTSRFGVQLLLRTLPCLAITFLHYYIRVARDPPALGPTSSRRNVTAFIPHHLWFYRSSTRMGNDTVTVGYFALTLARPPPSNLATQRCCTKPSGSIIAMGPVGETSIHCQTPSC